MSFPFTVILSTLYPSFGVIIMSSTLFSPLSTLSYGVFPSPEMFPPIPSTFVVILYCIFLIPAFTFSSIISGELIVFSFVISSVCLLN